MELYIIIALLAVVAFAEAYRTYLGLKPETKADKIKRFIQDAKYNQWKLEFQIFKTREIREDIRQEYDMLMSKRETIRKQVEEWPADKDAGEKARFEDQIVLIDRDISRFEAQMKQLDSEVEGTKPNPELPSGQDGLVQVLDGWRETEKMLRDYLAQEV